MKKLIQRVQRETPKHFDYEWLGAFVRSIDLHSLNYKEHLPALDDSGSYSRNILCLEPFEVVLLHWPAGVESAVHLHEGFWGYVLCLEGQIDNVTYHENGSILTESVTSRAYPRGIINEPDGTIHKIVNSDADKPLVTLHFYYPALEDLDGLVLYDLETGTKGILNEKAATASFSEPDDHFKSRVPGTFTFEPLNASRRSHTIFPIIPKPEPSAIRDLVGQYYDEQAQHYDSFDLNHTSRQKYTSRINHTIADFFGQHPVSQVLDLACGTGRRAIAIQEISGLDYEVHGVDISVSMGAVAEARGVRMHIGPWLDIELHEEQFDAITFLYAYGHIPTVYERKAALQKIHKTLKPGGFLFMDVFNANDRNEWGPRAIDFFDAHNLEQQGYESGDVFYRKTDGTQVAFLHYCQEEDMVALLKEVGFEVEKIMHIGYVHQSGEILDKPDEGSLFFRVRKPIKT